MGKQEVIKNMERWCKKDDNSMGQQYTQEICCCLNYYAY